LVNILTNDPDQWYDQSGFGKNIQQPETP